MCDITFLRNWLIGLAAAVGWAVSSGWFAYGWMGNPFFAVVAKVSWTITAIASMVAVGILYATMAAVASFCGCVSAISACKLGCDSIRYALIALLAPLLALMVIAAGGGFDRAVALIAMFNITFVFGILTTFIAVQLASLGSCQSRG